MKTKYITVKEIRKFLNSEYKDNSSEIITETNHVPTGWMEITERDFIENLKFAIDQLEVRGKPYMIKKHRGRSVSVWVKRT